MNVNLRKAERPDTFARHLDLICDRFESQWRAGHAPKIAEYLLGFTGEDYRSLAVELIALDIEYRDHTRSAAPISQDDYLPWLLPDPDLQSEVRQLLCEYDRLPSAAAAESPTPAEQWPVSGDVIAQFELLEIVGRGTFGTVWKAHDRRLDRQVAIKVPHQGQLTAEEIEQVTSEARTIAQLRHLHIVSVHEVGQINDRVYTVTDFIEGDNLAEWLKTHRPSTQVTVDLMIDIAEALDHAHRRGVVHRDLKPANIIATIVDGDILVPHLTDFGLASRELAAINRPSCRGMIIGTPAYMPPELATGDAEKVDHRADIYSAGAILFELLTGERPFRGSLRVLLHQVVHEPPPSPRLLDSRISLDLETICLKCLEKNPQRRYGSAAELADDLRRYRSGRPINARPISRVSKFTRLCRRNRLVAGLGTGLVLSLCIGLATVFVLWRRSEEHARQMRRQMFVSNLHLAAGAWEVGDVESGLRFLAGNSGAPSGEDMRGFVWHHLRQKMRRSEILADLNAPLSSLVTTSDGDLSAISDENGRVFVIDGNSNQIRQQWQTRTEGASAIAVLAEKKQLIVGTSRGHLTLYDMDSGEQVASVVCDRPISAVTSLSDSGKTVIATGQHDGSICLYTPELKEFNRLVLAAHSITTLTPSPNGKLLAAADLQGHLYVFEISSWTPLIEEQVSPGAIRSLAWSSDSHQLALVGEAPEIQIWDVNDKRRNELWKHPGHWMTRVLFAPGDQHLLVASGRSWVERVEISTGLVVDSYRGHTHAINGLCLAPGGTSFATASTDGTIRAWRLDSNNAERSLVQHTSTVKCVAFSPDGSVLASAGYDSTIQLTNPENGASIAELSDRDVNIVGIDISFDGKLLAAACSDGEVTVWDLQERQVKNRLKRVGSNSLAVRFTRSDYTLAAGYEGGAVCLWNASSGTLIDSWSADKSGVFSIDFSADGRSLVTGGFDGHARRWDVASGKLQTVYGAGEHRIYGVRLSPDGETLAISSRERTIQLWGYHSGRFIAKLAGHGDVVNVCDFSPDGWTLASGSWDGTVKLWDLRSHVEKATFLSHSNGVAFSRDGTMLASGNSEKPWVKIWYSSVR